jgi:hypothetical protein
MKNNKLFRRDYNLRNAGGRLLLYFVIPRLILLCLLASVLFPSLIRAQDAPVFVITPGESTMTFAVKASVAIVGKFDKWDATLTFYVA